MINFGTDGWRARLDGDFTAENLVRIADAAGAVWAQGAPGAIVYVGYDARSGADRFALLAAEVLAAHGLAPKISDRPSPMPALSWAVANDPRACGGFEVTGSHYPPDYLGVRLRGADGGTLSQDTADTIAAYIDSEATPQRGPVSRSDFVTPYFDRLCSLADAEAISAAGLRVVYDPLYGAGRGLVPQMLGALGVDVVEIHGSDDADTPNIHPDAVEPWIDDCEQAVVAHGAVAGLITDGDAARAGAVDEYGRLVPSHKIIALLIEHLVRHHGLTGRVAINQSTSVIARRVARELGCRVSVKPVGFRHICDEIRKGGVLIGGEESGGIGIPAFGPERDGIAALLLLCEQMGVTGKTLSELSAELDERFGATSYGQRDLRLEAEVIETFRTLLPGLNPRTVAGKTPVLVSHMDGLRLEFDDESWLLLRPSGTEPVVRVCAEATTVEARDELLEEGCDLARGELGI